MRYDINNVNGFRIPKKKIDRMFKVAGGFFPKVKKAEVSMAFIGDRQMKKLNTRYRRKKSTTDVLSFPEYDRYDQIQPETYLGEIVISFPTAKHQALRQGHAISREILILSIHGLLHLLGYDHLNKKDEQEMKRLEKTILYKV